jgi:hypothetical protein
MAYVIVQKRVHLTTRGAGAAPISLRSWSSSVLRWRAGTNDRAFTAPECRFLRQASFRLGEEGHMNPEFLAPLIPVTAIIAYAVIKIAKIRAARPDSVSADVTARLEALEHGVESLQQDLVETQERLDFAERLLTKARDERQIGNS